jgi:hypothetical protein
MPPCQYYLVTQVHGCIQHWQVWLEGLETKLKTFDTFRLPYSNASRQFIDAKYPGRVAFYSGNSRVTVPHYVSQVQAGSEPLCDVWFIDGDHSHGTPLADLKNALQVASHGATVIADDCTKRFPAVLAAWREVINGGTIEASFNRTMALPGAAGLKGWCVGRYAPPRSGRAERSKEALWRS